MNLSSKEEYIRDALLSSPKISLSNGLQHPQIGYGTYKVGNNIAGQENHRSTFDCITDAVELGYRFFDCAQFYKNESEIGEALNSMIQNKKVTRKELFLVSKVWNNVIEKGRTAVKNQCYKTLKDLKISYLDCYLIHWPVPNNKHVEAYMALQELHREGAIKSIGISNYTIEDYVELTQSSEFSIPPVIHQIQINPFLYRRKTINYFQKQQNMALQSYRTFNKGEALSHPTIVKLSQKYNKMPSQIIGRWCLQHGFIFFPKSQSRERMSENVDVFDFVLEEDDMNELDQLTTEQALQKSCQSYRNTVNKDTKYEGTLHGVKTDITLD